MAIPYKEFLKVEAEQVSQSMLVALNANRDLIGREPLDGLPDYAEAIWRPGSTGCVDENTPISLHSSDATGKDFVRMNEVVPLLDFVGGKIIKNDHPSRILSFSGNPIIPVLVVEGKLACLNDSLQSSADCMDLDWINEIKFDNGKSILASREHPFVFKADPDEATPSFTYVTGSIISVFGGEIELTIADLLEDNVGVGAAFDQDQVARVMSNTVNPDYDGLIYNIVVASPKKAKELETRFLNTSSNDDSDSLVNVIYELAAEADEDKDTIFGLDFTNMIMVNNGIYSGTLNLQLKFSIEHGKTKVTKRIPPKVIFRATHRI